MAGATVAVDQSGLIFFYVAALFTTFLGWLRSQVQERLEGLLLSFLAGGRLPAHVAFIMDGNRRYARRANLPDHTAGHLRGFSAFERVLRWALKLGIQTVTVYAFSVENFRRPPREVDMLMELAASKLEHLVTGSTLVHEHQIAIRIIGQLDLLPPRVRAAACRAMWATRHHQRHILNICLAYTSTAEAVAAGDLVRAAIREGLLYEDDLTADHVTQMLLQTHHSIPDLLIRTSGERRLSEFLTWQCTQTRHPPPLLVFLRTLWPDFGLWQMARVLLHYQLYGAGRERAEPTTSGEEPERWGRFLEQTREQHWQYIDAHRAAHDADSLAPPLITPPSSPDQYHCHEHSSK